METNTSHAVLAWTPLSRVAEWPGCGLLWYALPALSLGNRLCCEKHCQAAPQKECLAALTTW